MSHEYFGFSGHVKVVYMLIPYAVLSVQCHHIKYMYLNSKILYCYKCCYLRLQQVVIYFLAEALASVMITDDHSAWWLLKVGGSCDNKTTMSAASVALPFTKFLSAA